MELLALVDALTRPLTRPLVRAAHRARLACALWLSRPAPHARRPRQFAGRTDIWVAIIRVRF